MRLFLCMGGMARRMGSSTPAFFEYQFLIVRLGRGGCPAVMLCGIDTRGVEISG